MKIIAGQHRGATLKSPKGTDTRPTLGRVRESVFAILGPYFYGQVVVDLFAGAGGLGLEALSRHAAKCYFVELAKPALDCLRYNAEKLRHEPTTAIICARDAVAFCRHPLADAANLVLLDPPYHVGLADKTMTALNESTWLAPDAIVVCQCGRNEPVQSRYGALACWRTELYGETAVYFYKKSDPPQ